MSSFYFYDYETFGLDPAASWPAQFAGIRTDKEFNEIGEPLNLYCRLAEDFLPHPESCLVTGLTPSIVNKSGMIEPEFIRSIYQQFIEPSTCILGYNSIRFDDEVTRHILYRNFYDPYAHEYKNGNSRWDLIDLTRLVFALRPEGVEWPVKEGGEVSLRLEDITKANNIKSERYHDAVSDVRVTIKWAKFLRKKKPKVFDYVFSNKNKYKVLELLDLKDRKPLVHVSGMYGARRKFATIVMPLVKHPINSNGIIVYDLMHDVSPLLELSVAEIRENLFCPAEERTEKHSIIALKTVHINKCPILAPLTVLREQDKERLEIDMSCCDSNRKKILNNSSLLEKITTVFSNTDHWDKDNNEDPELMLYSGGFSSNHDRGIMSDILAVKKPEQLAEIQGLFLDQRFNEMLFRYRARHYYDTLNEEDRRLWKLHKKKCFTTNDSRKMGLGGFWKAMCDVKNSHTEQDISASDVLNKLSVYVKNQESLV